MRIASRVILTAFVVGLLGATAFGLFFAISES